MWHGSKNGTPPPPMISGFDNVCYRFNQYGTYEGIRGQISGWKFGTQYISRITRDYGASDEPHIASGGGKYLYWHICGDRESGWIDLSQPYVGPRGRGREGPIFSAYHLYKDVPGYDEMWFGVGDQDGTGNRLWGYYGSLNGIYHNQTNDQNPMVPYQGNLYVHRSNALICFGPEGGRVKGPKTTVQPTKSDTPVILSTEALKALLTREVEKWLDAGHLHIGYFNASQFAHTPGRYRGLNDYFASPAEDLWVLLRALPHVDEPLRTRLRAFIKAEREAFPPEQLGSIGWKDGASRDYFLYPPEVEADRVNFPPSPRNGERFPWSFALPPPESDWALYPYEINAYIAGHMGYLGLEKLAGQPASAAVQARLDELLAWRAEKFSKDTPFPSTGPYNKASV